MFRGDQAKNAELLVPRHENAVLRRHTGRVRFKSADQTWFTALTRVHPAAALDQVFPVMPATLLAWHRRLRTRRYDTRNRRPPG
jgi:putative transposase